MFVSHQFAKKYVTVSNNVMVEGSLENAIMILNAWYSYLLFVSVPRPCKTDSMLKHSVLGGFTSPCSLPLTPRSANEAKTSYPNIFRSNPKHKIQCF